MKKGIVFLTYDGYYNYTTGIGTQTKIFLRGLQEFHGNFEIEFGSFEVNLIVPKYDCSSNGFNRFDIDWANKVIRKTGGDVYTCDSVIDKPGTNFWSTNNWMRICNSSAELIERLSCKYQSIIVLAIDPPFMHVPRLVEMGKEKLKPVINHVILLYTSSFIHDSRRISFEKLGWEYSGLASSRLFNRIRVGEVGQFMKKHLIECYGVKPDTFVPYFSSIVFEDEKFKPLSNEDVSSILQRNRIPLNKPIIFAFGRAAREKGFDILIESLTHISIDAHLVLITTPFEISPEKYKKLLAKLSIGYSHISRFSSDLPRALCQHAQCKLVVCPSRNEPLSNIPFEVSVWAQKRGPVILTSNVDGYIEQVEHGETGFLFDIKSRKDLTTKILNILSLPDEHLAQIRLRAYKTVKARRNFYNNFKDLLSSFWKHC